MKRYFVYYKVEPAFKPDEELVIAQVIDPVQFRLVRVVYAEDLDQVYAIMQGENWSPNGEARFMIRSLELKHTSMSIGDVVLDESENKMYQCMRSDWEIVPVFR